VRVEIPPRTAIALLFAVLLVSVAGSMAGTEIGGSDDDDVEIQTITMEDGTELWPYTSVGQSTDQRTLALNVVVYGDAATTEHVLRERSAGDWEDVDENETDIAPDRPDLENETSISWGTADGAVRYVYIDPPGYDQPGRWVHESYQLKDGTYLGERHHIRAYADPVEGNWTAFQAHWEHWDWFELRHSVHSIEESQSYLEAEFFDRWYVESLNREWFANDRSSDSDGWMTVVHISDGAISALLAGLIVASFGVRAMNYRQQLTYLYRDEALQTAVKALTVVAAIVAVYMAVRIGGIQAELRYPQTHPYVIIGFFYPTLVLGMPIVAYLSARQLQSIPAFTAAAIGFTVAMFFDFSQLGVTSLSLHTFIHRVTLATAIGFIAAGASQDARSPLTEPGHVRTGVLLWLVAVGVPILGHL